MLGHLLRREDYIKIILEGRVEKRMRGRPRRYIDQIKGKVNIMSYQDLKEKAQDRTAWKLLHRQEPSY